MSEKMEQFLKYKIATIEKIKEIENSDPLVFNFDTELNTFVSSNNDNKEKLMGIYIIQMKWNNTENLKAEGVVDELVKKMEEKKATSSGYSSINQNNIKECIKDTIITLYVGRSQDMKSRMSQHAASGNRKNSALHINSWFPSINIEASIYLEYYNWNAFKIDSEEEREKYWIEETIWDYYSPLFGSRNQKLSAF